MVECLHKGLAFFDAPSGRSPAIYRFLGSTATFNAIWWS